MRYNGPVRTTERPKAIVFDMFGTVVDWRSSMIGHLRAFGARRGIDADWDDLVDRWRGAYAPSMDRVRTGALPWTTLDGLHRMSLTALVEELGIEEITPADLDELTRGWHRLQPWPDSVPGLTRLKRDFVIGPLSNGHVSLLVDVAKGAGLPWDVVLGSDLFGHYKPDDETYLGACTLLGLPPSAVMMAAAHPTDLGHARSLGLQTAYFPRPEEYGPSKRPAEASTQQWDVMAEDIVHLAQLLGA
jgi:2-haloacid dehalogenase